MLASCAKQAVRSSLLKRSSRVLNTRLMSTDAASPWRDRGLALSTAQTLHGEIKRLVPAALEHTGPVAFDEHLTGVEAVVRSWVPDDEDLALTGLFHSIYGTEGFQGFALPMSERPRVRELIGERAERLAWMFCCLDRSSLDRACLGTDDLGTAASKSSAPGDPSRLLLKARPELGAFALDNTEQEFLDLCLLFLADILEQVEGMAQKHNADYGFKPHDAWGYRRFAYQAMRDILVKERNLSVAADMYAAVFAQEPQDHVRNCVPLTPPITQAAKLAREAIASKAL